MKVLLLCMAFAAVSLAMPVAEEKQEVPIAPPSIPQVKSEEVKLQSGAQSVPVEEKKAEAVPEVKNAEKPEDNEGKNANAPIDASPEAQPEAKAAVAIPEVKKENIPENSAPVPVTTEIEASPAAEAKPEVKIAQPEVKPEIAETPKPEEIPAKVEEIIAPSAKSAITEDAIDVVSAIKNPAAVANDVVDPAGFNPISESQPIVSAKSASPEDANVEPSVSVKASPVEESRVEGPKPENKPAEVAANSDVSVAPKSAAVSDDSTRVIRDAVDEKKETETPQIEAKTVAEVVAVKDEVKPAEVQVEGKSAKPVEVEAPKESAPELQKIEHASEVVQEVKSAETPKEKEGKQVIPSAQPIDAVNDDVKPEVKSEIKPEVKSDVKPEVKSDVKPEVKSDVKPEVKSDEIIPNDEPSKKKTSSEESVESSEKNTETDSSEESVETSKDNAPNKP